MNDGHNPNLIKNGGSGTFVGNALRWIVSNGAVIAPDILNVAGNITGINSLNKLGDMIKGDDSITGESEAILLRELDKDISAEKQITKRWELDSKSQHWLPTLIRPLTLANFVILIDIVVLSSMWGKPLGEAYLPLIMTMGVTVVGGYFTLREYGKSKK